MASNGSVLGQGIAPVLAAYQQTIQPGLGQAQKAEALQFLEQFQKSPEAWNLLFEMLNHQSVSGPPQMFAATSLKGKMVHDIHQLPRDTLPALRDSLLQLLLKYADGPKPVRTQLTVSLAHLAIQMTEWKNVLSTLASTFVGKSDGAANCFLEFLKVLAEELTEARKINLSEDDLLERTSELLTGNAQQVFQILSGYAQQHPNASKNTMFISCVQSWTREIPLEEIIASPIMQIIITAIDTSEAFEAAIDCLGSMIRETKDVDDTMTAIQQLFPIIMRLQPKVQVAAEEEDSESFKGLARLFSETGEAWVVLIARDPQTFKPLVEAILEVSARDWEKEGIRYTFRFWEDVKLWLVMDKYLQAKQVFAPVFSQLVDVMIRHLQFPEVEGGNETDLFEGDREQEERFRSYRHEMGHVLKDCCEVLGPEQCLSKTYMLIKAWVEQHGSQVSGDVIPHWQGLEAPIFALRALGQVIPPDESTMLPQLIPILIQIPNHEKIRYQAVMTLGRYTDWTSRHPETLEVQLKFIMDAFGHSSKEVVRGATHAFQYFCTDCDELLKDFFPQLRQFYVGVLDGLSETAQADVTEGIAAILAKQPLSTLEESLKLCCDPIVERIVKKARIANDERSRLDVADTVQLLTIFIQKVQAYVPPGQPHPAVNYCLGLVPVLSELIEKFIDFSPILERVCRCWRYMILSYRFNAAPLLAVLPQRLILGFKATRQGCFLWAADSIVREFSEHTSEDIDPSIVQNIVPFYEQLANTFLTALTEVSGDQLPDLIEDFFRLSMDILLHHPSAAFKSSIMDPVLLAASHSLTLLKVEVLFSTLHFLRDFISYGTANPAYSSFADDSGAAIDTAGIQVVVKGLLGNHGKDLTQRVLLGMLQSFPEDVIPDASGVILDMLRVMPQQTGHWFSETLAEMPEGSVRPQERDKLVNQIQVKMNQNDMIKIRGLLQDFTSSYRRRNVAPREGLVATGPSRFVYKGS